MTIVAEEEVLAAAELDLATGDLAVDTASENVSPAAETAGGRTPFLVIEKGAPSDAEIAALVCVFAAAAAASAAPADNGPLDMWGRPTLLHRGSSPFSPYSYPQLSNLRF